MEELKNFIDNNRGDFENENLPEFHKKRFLLKLQKEHRVERRKYATGRIRFYLAAASVTLLLILTPLLYLNRAYTNRALDASDYIVLLEERSESITKMAEKLNPQEKNMVLCTLEQLTFEAVLFDSQLSDDVSNGERNELVKRYYSPKIEGVDKLKKYVTQLK
ncbi:MAG: hypothetical protein WCX48_04800 [Bacteroidales bacterium]